MDGSGPIWAFVLLFLMFAVFIGDLMFRQSDHAISTNSSGTSPQMDTRKSSSSPAAQPTRHTPTSDGYAQELVLASGTAHATHPIQGTYKLANNWY